MLDRDCCRYWTEVVVRVGQRLVYVLLLLVRSEVRAQELCQSRGGGRPGLPVPNSPYGLRGCDATFNLKKCGVGSRMFERNWQE